MDELFDAQEAAAYLKINEYTLRRMARDGQVPAFKVGRIWRFRKSDLDALATATPVAPENARILVIDDEPIVREMIRDCLKCATVVVDVADAGQDGLTLMERHPADLVFLDLSMPHMTGDQVCAHIQQRWPKTNIVIITAYPEGDLMNKAMQNGPVSLLAKPLSVTQIRDCVRRFGVTIQAS